MIIFEVEAEDLTNLGGPMGTESTSVKWRQPFETRAAAMKFAEADYEKERSEGDENIKWEQEDGGWSTQDLRFVMYHVRKVKVKK